ncbi:MAG: 50S ribosomal protein L4 [Alphaproteobacteria bacterium MarineAlpha3_Bin5]|nr:50S ribosomal protein L4 [Magnetovibrio sp.]PPR76797.1 MAG: 50S ribosomal protein L4 [Alphaproteobacteria bacterium MarineAlpha3_Bin5]
MKTEVISLTNKKSGTISLDKEVFGLEARGDILARVVRWQLSKSRGGNHKVKGRSEVTATKAKPFRQKGGGRARQGTKVAPQMRGGGVAFGPHVRNHSHKLPKKVRKLGLRTALSVKKAAGDLVILDIAEIKEPSTKKLAKQLKSRGWNKTLVIDGNNVNQNFFRSLRNLENFNIISSRGANVLDILRSDTLVLTKEGVETLTERLK